MKKYTIGVFPTRDRAEKAINQLHNELDIATEEISYVYQNTEGDVKEVASDEVSDKSPAEGAKDGAAIGGTVGAIAGIATVVGVIPVVGPIFAAGPLISALGLGAGALGTTAAGALTGAAAGGLVGALVAWGVSDDKAKEYNDSVLAGNVLVAVHAEDTPDIVAVFSDCGATDIDSYSPA